MICFTFSSVVFAAEPFFRLFATRNGTENQIIEVDKNNFTPRLGFAWTPNFRDGILDKIVGGANSTVIRGGYAIAYDQSFLQQILQTFPVVIDKVLVDPNNGNYSLASSKVINRVRPTDPFLFAGIAEGLLPTDPPERWAVLYNRNQDVATQIFGPTQNPLGGPVTLVNLPAGIRPTSGCMTRTFFAFTAFSNTAGNLLGIGVHNNGRPVAGKSPTFFRFTGPEAPISLGCWQDKVNPDLSVAFQNYRVLGGRPQLRVTARQLRLQNDFFNVIAQQRSYTPFTFTQSEDAFKFRFNTVTWVDRNENGRPDAVCYVKPTTNGSNIFCRGINENNLAPNTQPKKVSVGDSFSWWNTQVLSSAAQFD